MTNWKELSRETKLLAPKIEFIFQEWNKEYSDWTGHIQFYDYPPRFQAKLEILHVNVLSDSRLDELGILTTKICNECKLLGKKLWDESSKNAITYKFYLPIK